MSYEFGEFSAEKKSNKIRNLLLAIVIFLSILAVREVLSFSDLEINTRQKSTSFSVASNFSYSETQKPVSSVSKSAVIEEIVPEEPIFIKKDFQIQETQKENISGVLDIGILDLKYSNGTLSPALKNYANSIIEDEICLNVGQKSRFAISCANFTMQPLETRSFIFEFPFKEDGIYNSLAFLNRSDENSLNDNFSVQTKIGKIHDLAISELILTPDSENPLKVNIKVRIANNGDFDETSLALSALINNETKDYGPYDYIIKSSRTLSYSRTFKENANISVTFKITSYSNFALDSAEENNIKTSSIHLNQPYGSKTN